MNWKLRSLLWFVNHVQPLRDEDAPDIAKERIKTSKAANLGKILLDRRKPVKEVRDFKIGDIPVRLYRDSTAPDQKIIIYFHGGGFVFYNIDSHDNIARRLCRMNDCTVISVDYRLAPEHTFPAAHEDGYEVIRYIVDHADELRIDPAKIILAGDSAGGNISACACHHFKKDKNIRIAAQILIYPWIDGKIDSPSIDEYGEGFLLTRKSMLWFQKTYTPKVEDRLNPEVSPIYQKDFKNLPPVFLITAEYDPLKYEGKMYADKLKENGNVVLYKDYKELVHGFFNLPGLSDESMQVYYDIQAFIKKVV
ncbi:MAG: alpha/beta hydrolase [Bacteroidota bacterium]|nr:alpha/beta hydrolase [Bacteroidota bacterium]